jgi:DNA-binding HxlR family transcriptional regulator
MLQEGTFLKPCAKLSPDICQLLGNVLARVGDKWSMLVIVSLEDGPERFNALRRQLGISQKVLTSILRSLERDGYLSRHVEEGKLPQVRYALTALGHEVLTPVRALALWAFNRSSAIMLARESYDRRLD